MGLYNEVKSSYNLGPDFTNTLLQTKDIDESCLDFYWIDPKGQLFLVDVSNTADPVKTDTKFPLFKWVPNGNHGKVSPVYITEYVEVYNDPYKRCRIHFRDGVIQDFKLIDKKYG